MELVSRAPAPKGEGATGAGTATVAAPAKPAGGAAGASAPATAGAAPATAPAAGAGEYDVDDHMLSLEDLKKRYSASGIDAERPQASEGLSTEDAAALLAKNGPNVLSPPKDVPEIIKFLRHLFDVLLLMLMLAAVLGYLAYGLTLDYSNIVIAGVVTFMVGARRGPGARLSGMYLELMPPSPPHRPEGPSRSLRVLPSFIRTSYRAGHAHAPLPPPAPPPRPSFARAQVLLIASIGYWQERAATSIMNSIKNMVPSQCRVVRGGADALRDASSLVVGDIVHLTIGNRVPADIRMLATYDLKVEMSQMTGEPDALEMTP
jgi:hypothetical protein